MFAFPLSFFPINSRTCDYDSTTENIFWELEMLVGGKLNRSL